MLPIDATVDQAESFLDHRKCNSWPVGEGNFVSALINRRDLEGSDGKSRVYQELIDESHPATLRDLIDTQTAYPYVHPDHPVGFALERMRENGADVLPVVSRAGIHEICGFIGLKEILESYGVPTAKFFSRSTPA